MTTARTYFLILDGCSYQARWWYYLSDIINATEDVAEIALSEVILRRELLVSQSRSEGTEEGESRHCSNPAYSWITAIVTI